ncbi:deoxyribonuclease-2-beta isoform X1 [Bufo gargarizans]|uniref:deoxyribonuclease-2-beta isoform X1 n=1 Tax=Bufo gargarizans TaxID=30331 RepID=UPI001CF26E97|nr:deoxyribonuclease-2-beta isoform X1 [Bufo gargarizans]
MSGRCLWLLLCVFGVSLVTCEIACRNEDGDPVDWFVIYKLPVRLINRTGGPGVDYLYLDSKSQGWQVSKFLINMTQSAVAQVLQQLYQSYNRNDTAYMLYNDSPPGMNSSVTKRGHTKGALLFDKYQGFWLVHTVPHFPPFPEEGFGYPHTGRRYGQVALCVTYKYNQFKQIAAQLLYYNPNVYNCSIPDIYEKDLWGLYRICRGLRFPWIEATRLALLESAQGESFLNFAKSKFFQDDILTAWMAQKLQTDLLTETWQPKGTEVLSNCTLPWHVYTIKRIKFLNYSFYSRHDHSKWCVSRRNKDMWTCIGDLNRYPEQIWRSGGFVCTQNKLIYTAFRNIVAYYSDCG